MLCGGICLVAAALAAIDSAGHGMVGGRSEGGQFGFRGGAAGPGLVLRLDARGFRSNNLGFNSIWLCPSVGSMEWIRG